MLGESGVGKTCILERYLFNSFDENNIPTRTAGFHPKSIISHNGKNEIEFRIWDTAGQEVYRSLTSFYYKDANAAIIVYDVTKRKTFDEVQFWISEVKEKGQNDCLILLVGNKCDCIQNIVVEESDIRELAKKNNIEFMIVSAKEGINISNMFLYIIARMYPKLSEEFGCASFASIIKEKRKSENAK